MKKKIRVMLVEDHPQYREVVELALEHAGDMKLVNAFGTAERALLSLQDHQSLNEPDIILLDLNLPGMNGLDAIPLFTRAIPSAKILVLTQSDKESDVLKAIMQGTAGYLLKSSTARQIIEGIRTVWEGGASLDAGLARFILTTLKAKLPKGTAQVTLSPREMEILTLLASGLMKKEIADRLQISTTTVVTHVSHIYEKLKVTNAPAAIDKAHRLGFFPTTDVK